MKSLGTVLLLAFTATAAMGDQVIWDNYSTGYDENWTAILRSQLSTSLNYQVADDFTLTGGDSWTITDVHWTGVWAGFPPNPHATAFNIYIYADDGTGNAPTGGGLSNPETTALASYNIAIEDANETFTGLERFYEYDAVLPSSFDAAGNTKYWIAIQAVCENPGWGLARSLELHDSPHMVGYPAAGVPYWSYETDTDAAFLLTGIPEPGTLSLLVLGATALVGRRRRRGR